MGRAGALLDYLVAKAMGVQRSANEFTMEDEFVPSFAEEKAPPFTVASGTARCS